MLNNADDLLSLHFSTLGLYDSRKVVYREYLCIYSLYSSVHIEARCSAGRSDARQTTNLTRVKSSSWLSSLHASASFNTLMTELELPSSVPPSDMLAHVLAHFCLSIAAPSRGCLVPRSCALTEPIMRWNRCRFTNSSGVNNRPSIHQRTGRRKHTSPLTSIVYSAVKLHQHPYLDARGCILQYISCPVVERMSHLRLVGFPVTFKPHVVCFSRCLPQAVMMLTAYITVCSCFIL